MRTDNVLAGLLSVEMLKNQTLEERIKHLELCIQILQDENDEVYKLLATYQLPPKEEHHIGYKSNSERTQNEKR
jgi:hypothetical protein